MNIGPAAQLKQFNDKKDFGNSLQQNFDGWHPASKQTKAYEVIKIYDEANKIAPDDKCRAMCEKNKGILCNKMAKWESLKEEKFNIEMVKFWTLWAADHFTACYDLGRSANDEEWAKKLGVHMQDTWNIMFSILTKIDGDASVKIKLV